MRPYFLIVAASVCFGQGFSIGAIGGGRVTDDLTGAGATSVSKRYAIGPTVEVGLPRRLAVEFDALYRREGYQTAFGNFAYNVYSDERANSWEFPILLKYRLPVPVVKPFVEVGYAPRVIPGSITSDSQSTFPTIAPFQHST